MLTLFVLNTAPDASRLRLGSLGGRRSTYLEPKTVGELIWASTLAGMNFSWLGCISS